MPSPTHAETPTSSAGVDHAQVEPTPNPTALWEGDTGTLTVEGRKALVMLVKGPYLDANRHRDLWNALLGSQEVLRSRLADLFLELVLDVDRGMAFVRNIVSDALEVPVVVRTQPLTFVDTVVVLHLRSLLLQARLRGEAVLIDHEEIVDAVSVYRAHVSTDEAGFLKRVDQSVKKMKKASVLQDTQVENRYFISPVLELIFSADEVAAVEAQYRAMLEEVDDDE